MRSVVGRSSLTATTMSASRDQSRSSASLLHTCSPVASSLWTVRHRDGTVHLFDLLRVGPCSGTEWCRRPSDYVVGTLHGARGRRGSCRWYCSITEVASTSARGRRVAGWSARRPPLYSLSRAPGNSSSNDSRIRTDFSVSIVSIFCGIVNPSSTTTASSMS